MPEIAPLTKAHTKAMAGLHRAAFTPGWSAADFTAYIGAQSDLVLGLLDGEILLGFVVMRVQLDQAEILTITIASAQRGAGYGAMLLDSAETAAKAAGANIIFLEVAKDNAHALALYRAAGYAQYGIRPGYYRRAPKAGRLAHRVDALLFQKRLAPNAPAP